VKVRIGLVLAVTALVGVVGVAPAFAQGKPVAPGNATPQGFLPSTACGCHGSLVQGFQQSMHAKAIVDPVFLSKVNQAQAEAGEDVAIFCKRCHSPVGNMLGDFDGTGAVAHEGVTCMYCHQITGLTKGDPGNTSHLVDASQTRRAQLENPTAPHAADYSALHAKAEVCGGCHNVNHPGNGTHLETSYSEWAASPYAKEGVVCQDCHMSAKAGTVGPSSGTAAAGGAQRDNLYAMTFVGANVAQGSPESATLLKSAAEVTLDVPPIVAAGQAATVTVTVTNKGAGHYLPTGLTEVREMWLSVYAEDADGTRTDLGEHRFGTKLKDANGAAPTEMWNAVAIESDDRIPPKESVRDEFEFTMPAGTRNARIVAVLNYRSMPDELAKQAGVKNPVTEMAIAGSDVYPTQAARDAAAQNGLSSGSGLSANWILMGLAGLAVIVLAVMAFLLMRRKPA